MFYRLARRIGVPLGEGEGRIAWAIVGALLLAHVAWICVHLNLVAQEAINPWKLGGYGMYTVPHNNARTHLFLFDPERQTWVPVPDGAANSFNFDTANHLHVFRCRLPSKASLTGLMDENPHLRYRPLTIALSEQQFSRYPIEVSREIYARIEIVWVDRTEFRVHGVVCSDIFEGTVSYSAPPENTL